MSTKNLSVRHFILLNLRRQPALPRGLSLVFLYNASDPTSPIYINLSTLLYSVHLSWLNATKILVSPIDPKLRSLLEDNGDVKDDSTGPDF